MCQVVLFSAENNLGNEGWRGSCYLHACASVILLLTKRLVRQPSRGQRKGTELGEDLCGDVRFSRQRQQQVQRS